MSCKRQQIIGASATLIHSKGYESTTLSDILDAAQIGKGQFYHYFSTKHELGLAVVDYLFEGWNPSESVKAILEATGLEYEYVSLAGKRISGCIGCTLCAADNQCKLNDDWNEIGEKML